jgi:hypothetical protein
MSNRRPLSLKVANHPVPLWIAAFIITLATAFHQRMTGPSYPVRGRIEFNGGEISFRLLRSANVGNDAAVAITVPDASVTGYVEFGRFKAGDNWETIDRQTVELTRESEKLLAQLPAQPAAGKLMYKVFLRAGGQTRSVTGDSPVVIRYKGHVPPGVLIPHIFFMFMSMLYSTRAFLESLDADGRPFGYMIHTMWLLVLGGLIFGPLVQKYAFGVYWDITDFTDSKTAIAMLGWIVALVANWKSRDKRGWIILAAVVMFVIFSIPHSVLGSELDYTKLPSVKG